MLNVECLRYPPQKKRVKKEKKKDLAIVEQVLFIIDKLCLYIS